MSTIRLALLLGLLIDAGRGAQGTRNGAQGSGHAAPGAAQEVPDDRRGKPVPNEAASGIPEVPIRVIVNPGVRVESLGLKELNRLYLGDVTSLPGGARVTLAEQVGARQRFYAAVTRMTEDTFRRHWIRVVFAGNPVSPPTPFATALEVVQFVARTPGAIGFVEGLADETVRVLKIDAKEPGDPTYPLR